MDGSITLLLRRFSWKLTGFGTKSSHTWSLDWGGMKPISRFWTYMPMDYKCIKFHVKPLTYQYSSIQLHSLPCPIHGWISDESRRRFAKGSKGRCQSNIYSCHSEKVSKCVSTVGATIHFVQNNWSFHKANVYQHFRLIEVPFRTKSTGLDDKEFLFPIL